MRRPVIAGATAAVLAVLAVLHAVWAFSPWPFRTWTAAATYLYGHSDEFPPPWACLVVAGLLVAAGYLVAAAAGVVPRSGWLPRAGAWGVAVVLAGRGLLGPFLETAAAPEYVFWNLRLYSPLCLVLALGAAVAATTRRNR